MEAAIKLFNRLSEVEKIMLRAANPARIEYLADTDFRGDLVGLPLDERAAIVSETAALCNLQSASKSADVGFGQTWLY